jgi:DNA-binding NarL/FixJ family response regulator
MIHSIRELTPRQQQIADGIRRGLSYAQIGVELTCSEHTVRAHVRAMANLIDADDGALSPRERILMLVAHERWAAERAR